MDKEQLLQTVLACGATKASIIPQSQNGICQGFLRKNSIFDGAYRIRSDRKLPAFANAVYVADLAPFAHKAVTAPNAIFGQGCQLHRISHAYTPVFFSAIIARKAGFVKTRAVQGEGKAEKSHGFFSLFLYFFLGI